MTGAVNTWRRYRKGRVQHFIVRGLYAPLLACQARCLDGNGFEYWIEVEPDDLSEARDLPRCRRCWKTHAVRNAPYEAVYS